MVDAIAERWYARGMNKPVKFVSGVLVGVAVGVLASVLAGDLLSLDGFARFAVVILVGGAVAFTVLAVGERFRRDESGSE